MINRVDMSSTDLTMVKKKRANLLLSNKEKAKAIKKIKRVKRRVA